MNYYLSRSLSWGAVPTLPTLLGGAIYPIYSPFHRNPQAFLGWGYKKKSLKTKATAFKAGKPFYFLEDGFLRSLYPSHLSKMPLSIIKDENGLYFDYKARTNLEALIGAPPLTLPQQSEAEAAIDFFTTHKLSKYVIGGDPQKDIPPKDLGAESYVILDQTLGDCSLEYGGISSNHTSWALKIIKDITRDKKTFIKAHPDVIAGKKKSILGHLYKDHQFEILPEGISAPSIFARKPNIITLTSLAGFESLLYGCKAHILGVPWYAGYGLTHDYHPEIKTIKPFRPDRNLAQIFYAAYLKYPIYFNPSTLQIGNFWDIAPYLARSAKHIRDMSGTLYTFGIRPWKRKDLGPYIKNPFNKIIYATDHRKSLCWKKLTHKKLAQKKIPLPPANEISKILVWGYKYKEQIEALIKENPSIKIIRIEDGFIRSYGLGKSFIPPLSLAFDTNNLYYHDGEEKPSDIHGYIQNASEYRHLQANRLRQKITDHHITKYNLDKNITPAIYKTDKPILLVVGQVEGDASLHYGGLPENIKGNDDLLKYARENFKHHYIVYRPHPDVPTALDVTKNYADYIDTKTPTLSIILSADDVLCMTSLSGFEARIRNKKTHILGNPFYKRYSQSKAIIIGALMDYPIYKNTDRLPLEFGTAERAIEKILKQKNILKNPLGHLHHRCIWIKRLYQMKKWAFG